MSRREETCKIMKDEEDSNSVKAAQYVRGRGLRVSLGHAATPIEAKTVQLHLLRPDRVGVIPRCGSRGAYEENADAVSCPTTPALNSQR